MIARKVHLFPRKNLISQAADPRPCMTVIATGSEGKATWVAAEDLKGAQRG